MATDIKGNFIAGEWILSRSVLTNDNPSDLDRPLGNYASADPADIDRAMECAQDASKEWRHSNLLERANILDRIGNEIIERSHELGRQLSLEEGKVLGDGVAEVTRAGQIFKFYAGEALRLEGDSMPSLRPAMEIEVRREALGIIAVITPWNFPMGVAAWKIAPALACGNCVLLKPSEITPASAWSLAEILSRAGLPRGVFQLILGEGVSIGSKLTGHPNLNGISFTGSTATGRIITKNAAPNFCRLQLEMGGKNPLVILKDADLDTAVASAFQGAFLATGQRCTASSRLIVEEAIHDRFVTALIERMRRAKIGHALEEENEIGPVVDIKQLGKNQEYIAIGLKEGAKLAYGGELLSRSTRGHYMNLALFTETSADMRINREEIFGPVATVLCVKDYDEALSVANDSEYGLTSGIVTQSLKYAQHFKTHSESGIVAVNGPTAGADFNVPFGGRKNSSYGWRETGRAAKDFYSVTKTSYIKAP